MVHKHHAMTPWKTLSRRLAFDASPYLRVFHEEVEVAPDHVIPDFVDNGNQRGAHGYDFLALDYTPIAGRQANPTEAAAVKAMTRQEVDRALDAGRFGVIHHVAGWCLARRHLDVPPG